MEPNIGPQYASAYAQVTEYLGMLEIKIRAAAYVRISDPSKEDSITLQSQLDEIRRYCKRMGYILEDEDIYMEALSAVNLPYWRREKLVTMLNRIEGNIDVVVVHAFSRLARRQVEQFVLGDKIEKAGARIESCTEKFEDSAIGRFMRQTVQFAAEFEIEKIRERIDRGRRKKAQYGLLGQGDPLYGYQFADLEIIVGGKVQTLKKARYVLNDTESIAVERIAMLADEGMSNRRIAITMTQDGYKPRKGGSWSQATISQILRDRSYTGEGSVFRTKVDGEDLDRKNIAVPEEDWVKLPTGIVPVIIPLDQFERIQERLKNNKVYSAHRNNTPPAELLRCGHAVCAICGGRLHVAHYSKPKPGRTVLPKSEYFCRKNAGTNVLKERHTVSISVEKLDTYAWEVALKHIANPQLVAEKVAELRKENKLLGDSADVKKKLETVKKKLDNLFDLASNTDDQETRDDLKVKMSELEKQRNELKGLLKKIERDDDDKAVVQEKIDEFEGFAHNFLSLLGTDFEPDYKMKLSVIQTLGIRAVVYPYNGNKPRVQIELMPPKIVSAALQSRYSTKVVP